MCAVDVAPWGSWPLASADPEFATLYLLGAPVIAGRTREFVDVERRRVNFVALLRASRGWSHAEKLLITAALDMWNGNGKTRLGELLFTLDEDNMRRVIEAIGIRRREHLGRLDA